VGAEAGTPPSRYLAGGLSEKGRRESNEDAAILAVLPPASALRAFAVLSDGMGGHNAGEVASRLAVEIFKEKVQAFAARPDAQSLPPATIEAEIREWIAEVNREIYQRGKASAEQKGMGATLAFAIGLPALADKYTGTFGGENGLVVNPPTPPSWLGANFPLERWEAWIAGLGALVVLFVMNNLVRSGVGRSFRAVRDDEIAASLCGLRVGRVQTLAFVLSAGCAGLGGGLLTVVLQLASPGAFQLELSLSLLTAIVLGGLGSLLGAVWGAAVLVLLPSWTNDIAHSFSLSTGVSANMPLAIYGIVLITAMLVWPSGIQGGVRAVVSRVGKRRGPRAKGAAP